MLIQRTRSPASLLHAAKTAPDASSPPTTTNLRQAGNGSPSRRWINGVWKALRPYASGQAYQNYIDPQLNTWQRSYYASNLPRLREIKQQVDPDFMFRFRQAIPPAG